MELTERDREMMRANLQATVTRLSKRIAMNRRKLKAIEETRAVLAREDLARTDGIGHKRADWSVNATRRWEANVGEAGQLQRYIAIDSARLGTFQRELARLEAQAKRG